MLKGLSVSDGDGCLFAPLLVLELSSDTKDEAISWLLTRIRDKQQNGGTVTTEMDCIVHISTGLSNVGSLQLRAEKS